MQNHLDYYWRILTRENWHGMMFAARTNYPIKNTELMRIKFKNVWWFWRMRLIDYWGFAILNYSHIVVQAIRIVFWKSIPVENSWNGFLKLSKVVDNLEQIFLIWIHVKDVKHITKNPSLFYYYEQPFLKEHYRIRYVFELYINEGTD